MICLTSYHQVYQAGSSTPRYTGSPKKPWTYPGHTYVPTRGLPYGKETPANCDEPLLRLGLMLGAVYKSHPLFCNEIIGLER